MYKAICIRDCIWRGRYWYVGEPYSGKERPPQHFKITEEPEEPKAKKGKKGEDEPQNEDASEAGK